MRRIVDGLQLIGSFLTRPVAEALDELARREEMRVGLLSLGASEELADAAIVHGVGRAVYDALAMGLEVEPSEVRLAAIAMEYLDSLPPARRWELIQAWRDRLSR